MLWEQEIAGSSPAYPTMANKTLTIKDICDGYTDDYGLSVDGTGVQYDSSIANKLITHEELEQYGATSGEGPNKAKKVVSTTDRYNISDEHYVTIKYSISWHASWTSIKIYAMHGADIIGSVTINKGVASSGNLKINYLKNLEEETAYLEVDSLGTGIVIVGIISPNTFTLKHNSTVNATVKY